ncbi:SPOSA6832_04437, partial [Sporobolomyces salmonicolor]
MASSRSSSAVLNHPVSHMLLPDHVPAFRCLSCSLELALLDELVSRSFQGSSGPAYLLRSVLNADVGQQAAKQLISGRHIIAPSFTSLQRQAMNGPSPALTCNGCSVELGWKYFVSPDSSQKYKEGKYILEKSKIYK